MTAINCGKPKSFQFILRQRMILPLPMLLAFTDGICINDTNRHVVICIIEPKVAQIAAGAFGPVGSGDRRCRKALAAA